MGDCGYCSPGCTYELISNEICDSECYNKNCGYDNMFCGKVCSENCTKSLLLDPVCQPECANIDCFQYNNNASCFIQCSQDCYFFMQGDGICNLECNNLECLFDLDDCSCSEGCYDLILAEDECRSSDPCNTKSCNFKNGKCGFCSPGCFLPMLGDNICDLECNTESCEYDQGDCGCAANCTSIYLNGEWSNLESNKANLNCLVPSCFYNMFQVEDLFWVRWVVLNQLYYGNLNLVKTPENLASCSIEKLRLIDDKSYTCEVDDVCLNEAAVWCLGLFQVTSTCLRSDFFQCLVCKGVMIMGKCQNLLTDCPQGFEEFSGLSGLFESDGNKWCLLKAEFYHKSGLNVFWVQSAEQPSASGTGSESDPFQSLYYGFSQVYGLSVKFILSTGNHIYLKHSMSVLPLRKSSNEPLNYDYGITIKKLVLEGIDDQILSVVYFKGSVSISSNAVEVLIRNIEFRGDKIIRDDCDGTTDLCFYCPFYDPYTGMNDLGLAIEDEFKTFYEDNDCSSFRNDQLFVFNGKVKIENVKFTSFRQQFKTLIMVRGDLNITNVRFSKIQPGVEGLVVSLSCFEDCKNENFEMNNCDVEDLNPGYEERAGIQSGSFLKVSGIHSITVKNSNFRYNFLYSNENSLNPAYMLKLENLLGTIAISSCLFEVNFLNHLLDVDSTSLEYDSYDPDIYDQSKNYNQIHFRLENLNFSNNLLTGYLVNYNMRRFLHNILIKNLNFNQFYSIKLQVLKFSYEGPLYDYIPGYIEVESKKIWKPFPYLIINQVNITESLLNNSLIELNSLGITNVSNIFIKNIQTNTQGSPTFQVKSQFESAGRYLKSWTSSLYAYTIDGFCGQAVRAVSCFNVSVQFVFIDDWMCIYFSQRNQGIHIQETEDVVIVSDVNVKNLNSIIDFGTLITCIDNTKEIQLYNINAQNIINAVRSIILIKSSNYLFMKNIKIAKCESFSSSVVEMISVIYTDVDGIEFNEIKSNDGMSSCLYIELDPGYVRAVLIKNGIFFRCLGFSTTSSLLVYTAKSAVCSLQLNNIKLDECYSEYSSILRVSSNLNILGGAPSLSNSEIINSIANSVSMIEINNEASFEISNLTMSNNSALFVGIYISSLSSKFIRVTNVSIFNSISKRSIINMRTTVNDCGFYFKNLTIFNISNDGFSPIVFDMTKSLINGSEFTVYNVGGLIYADEDSLIDIFNSTFYSMDQTVISLSGKSKFNCVNCSFYENRNKLIKSIEESIVNFDDCLIYRNFFDSVGTAFIEINSASMYADNKINNTEIFKNYIYKGKLISVMASSLVVQESTIRDNEMYSAEYYGIELIESNLNVINSIFKNQSSSTWAAFINAYSNSSVKIDNSSFISGKSSESAGSLYLHSGSLSITSSTFTSNSASNLGGSIYLKNSFTEIFSCIFEQNSAINGTDIYLESSTIYISDTKFSSFTSKFSQDSVYSLLFISSKVEIDFCYFTQSTINVSSLCCKDCETLIIQDSNFYHVSSSENSALTTVGKTMFGKVQIVRSSFIENTSWNKGGAVYVKNMELDIFDCFFDKNFALRGGAVFYESPDCDYCDFLVQGENIFYSNKAKLNGGCIAWSDTKPIIENSTKFENNSAIYGPIKSSIPAFLQPTTSRYLLNQTGDYEIFDVPPGQEFSSNLKINLLDTYGETVTTDNTSQLKLEVIQSSSFFSLSGSTQFQSSSGRFDLTGFYIVGPPDSVQYMRAYCDSIPEKKVKNDENVYKNDLIIKVNLRKCLNGEQIGTDSCKVCEEGKYLIEAAGKCKNCPVGGICPGGDKIYVKSGYYRSHFLSEIVYSCDLSLACFGNNQDYVTICEKGYSGIKCGVCDSGYSKSTNYRCNKCPNHTDNIVLLFFLIVAVLFVCVVLVKITIKSAYYPKSKQSIYIKILANYLHLIYMISQFNFSWPDYVVKFFDIHKSASIVTESVISLDCYIKSKDFAQVYYLKLLAISLVPLFIFLTSYLVWLSISFFKETYKYMKREVYLTMIVVYFLAFPTIVKTIFSSFDCVHFDIIGEYLAVDYSIKCETFTHIKYLMIISLPSIILWIFGFPLMILILLIKKRKNLRQEDNKVVFGLLFNGYSTSVFYWEFIIMYRKVLIICIVVFVKRISVNVQGITLVLLLLISYELQYRLYPYDSKELNKMEKDALVSAIVTSFCGIYYLTEDLNTPMKAICFLFIIFFNVRFLYFWLFWFSKTFIEFLMKILPWMSILRKGDTFDDEFFTEEIPVNGFIPGTNKSRRIYTMFEKTIVKTNPLKCESLNELYQKVALNEMEEDDESEDRETKSTSWVMGYDRPKSIDSIKNIHGKESKNTSWLEVYGRPNSLDSNKNN